MCNNLYEGEIRFAVELLVMTKPDKSYHGYGMSSVRKIVWKYGGTMNGISKDGVFTLHILIPEKSERKKKNESHYNLTSVVSVLSKTIKMNQMF